MLRCCCKSIASITCSGAHALHSPPRRSPHRVPSTSPKIYLTSLPDVCCPRTEIPRCAVPVAKLGLRSTRYTSATATSPSQRQAFLRQPVNLNLRHSASSPHTTHSTTSSTISTTIRPRYIRQRNSCDTSATAAHAAPFLPLRSANRPPPCPPTRAGSTTRTSRAARARPVQVPRVPTGQESSTRYVAARDRHRMAGSPSTAERAWCLAPSAPGHVYSIATAHDCCKPRIVAGHAS